MISIKRKTLAILILAMLALLVAPGCNDSSTSVPADSTDSAVVVSTSVPPDTTDPIPNVDEASGQTDSEPVDDEPVDDEPVDNLTSDKLSLLPKIMASESATDINEETLELGTFIPTVLKTVVPWSISGTPHARAVLRDSSRSRSFMRDTARSSSTVYSRSAPVITSRTHAKSSRYGYHLSKPGRPRDDGS